MTRKDLAVEVSGKTGMTKGNSEACVDEVLDAIAAGLKKGEKIDLRGFGVFKVKDVPARTGRNPKTGAEVQIPAKKKITFKASKDMGV